MTPGVNEGVVKRRQGWTRLGALNPTEVEGKEPTYSPGVDVRTQTRL